MASNYRNLTYNVDMVFCIDCTGSMENIIDIVKRNALNFYHDVTSVMEKKNKHITQLRVRVVAFRDYLADGADAMMGCPGEVFEKQLRETHIKIRD